MKWLIKIILLLLLSNQVITQDSSLMNNVYKIGLPNVPGFMFTDANGEPKGLPLEVLQKALDDGNIKYEWVKGSWHDLFHKAKEGEIDLLPGAVKTEERYEYFDYCEQNLYLIWSEVFIAEDSDYYNINDFNNKKIGLVYEDQNAAGLIAYFSEFHIEFEKVYFDSHSEAAEAVRKGEIFGFAGPNPNVLYDIFVGIKRSGLYFNPTHFSYAFPKNTNQELRIYLDQKILACKNDPNSLYNRLISKYRISHISPSEPFIPKWLSNSLLVTLIFGVAALLFIWLLRSQIKSKTKELVENQEILSNALELGKMGAWEIDLKNQYVIRSKEMLKLLKIDNNVYKYSMEELMNSLHPDSRQQAQMILKQTREDKKHFNVETKMLDNNGNILYTQQIGYVKTDSEGNAVSILGITQDISDRKEYEMELIKAKEKAEENEKLKSAFLANMSHEIRTPLNAIVGFSNLLASDDCKEHEKAEFMNIIKNQNDILLNLISDIIDFARIESGTLNINNTDIIDLQSILDDIFIVFENKIENNVELIKNYPDHDETLAIKADSMRLNQIITNFVSNAVKFTEKGTIEIGYRKINGNKTAEIYVKDTGFGIPNDKIKEVFNRFTKLHNLKQGTGLGLSISKYIADKMGAEIDVKSEVGKGSEFILRMKYFKVQKAELKTNITENTHKVRDNINILIAEDINSNYLLLKNIFKNHNYSIVRAKTGIEAVEFFRVQKYDIILMDIKMPEMNGLEATKIIKSMSPNVPIIAVTAYALNSERVMALEAGCDDVITKPVDKKLLFDKINSYVG